MILSKTSVPVCRQTLKGWSSFAKTNAQEGSTRLQSLNLPSEVNLELNDLSLEGNANLKSLLLSQQLMTQIVLLFLGLSDDVFGNIQPPPLIEMYQLRIKYTNENRYLTLNFPATKTILDIKNDLYAVLKVPVRFQQWKGWPVDAPGTAKLGDIGIEPIHNLEMTRISENAGASSLSM